MERITRKSIAFERKELAGFEKLIRKKGYKNRSEAIRDLIRKALVEEERRDPEQTMMGTLTIVYDHHDHDVQHELTHAQHHAGPLIISTMHTHMDERNCLEVLVLKGKVKNITHLADMIIATRGVYHGKLVLTDSQTR